MNGGEVVVTAAIEARFSIEDTSDLNNYRAQPGNWNTQLSLLGRGNFHSRVRSIELPGLKIWDTRWGAACQAIGQSPDDWLMLGTIDTSDGPGAHWGGRRVDEAAFACTSSGKQMEFNTLPQTHSVVILVRPGLLQRTCGYEVVEFIKTHQSLCFDILSGSALVELIVDLLDRCEAQSQLLKHSAIVAWERSNLLRALEQCFASFFQQDESTPHIREGAFHEAVLHVKNTPLITSAWHMAQAAGVSQKTLEVAFRECINITPGRYLTLTRLNGAHRQLALGQTGEFSVIQTLVEWGFSHPGRFANAYQQLFGELPSQTLRRPASLD
jgi:AraC-like DNA-binding protein